MTTNNQSSGITSNVANHHHHDNHHQQQQEDNDLSSTNHIKKFKPRYLRMSDKMFKQMLSNEMEHDDNAIHQCLDTKEKIEFVRQMTEATNNLYYFDLQRQLWQAYDDIGTNRRCMDISCIKIICKTTSYMS